MNEYVTIGAAVAGSVGSAIASGLVVNQKIAEPETISLLMAATGGLGAAMVNYAANRERDGHTLIAINPGAYVTVSKGKTPVLEAADARPAVVARGDGLAVPRRGGAGAGGGAGARRTGGEPPEGPPPWRRERPAGPHRSGWGVLVRHRAGRHVHDHRHGGWVLRLPVPVGGRRRQRDG